MDRWKSIADGRGRLGWIGLGGVVSVILLAHAWTFLPFLSDDALISLRYAQRLLDGAGLTWTDGIRVEGYSNLLWVLMSAGLGALGLDGIDAVRVLGALCAWGLVLAVARAAWSEARPIWLPLLGGTLGVALSASVAAWTVGGLETPAVAACLAWALVATYSQLQPQDASGVASRMRPSALAVGAAYAPLCWLRPDGALLVAAAALGLVAARGPSREALRCAAQLLVMPALAVAAQLVFRLVYYGEWLPNTAHAKLAFSSTHLVQGVAYVGAGLGSHLPWVAWCGVLAVAAGRDPVSGPRCRLLGTVVAVWCVYVAAVGGDVFPAYRQLVPVFALLGLIAVEGLAVAAAGRSASIAAVVTVFALLGGIPLQAFDASVQSARSERWEWDGEVVGRLLAGAFADEQPLLAVDPAGTLPYFSGLPSIDMLGLNDAYLARHRPADFGTGWIGHELGNGAYVLDREPDLILFCLPAGGPRPCFRSGIELSKDPRFRRNYRSMRVEGRDPYVFRSELFVRFEGGRIGVERREGRVRIRAHLLMGNPATVATPDAAGRLEVEVSEARSAVVGGVALPAGRWQASLDGSRLLRVSVATNRARATAQPGKPVVFDAVSGELLRIEVEAPAAGEGDPALFVRAVELTRLEAK